MAHIKSVTSKDDLKALDTLLASVSYIDGWLPSSSDIDVFAKFGGKTPSTKDYPHIARWYAHIGSYAQSERSAWVASTSSPVMANGAAGAADDDDDEDDVDLFGDSGTDDDEADAEKERVKQERLAAYAAKKAKKPGPIAKSNVIFDVKPWDDTTDMKECEKKVREIEADGLLWGSAKLMPVAFGIKKLQIGCVVEDLKVSVDWLEEKIMEFEDFVQSVDIAAFQKI